MPKADTQQWLDKAAEDEQVVNPIRSNSGPWGQAAYHVQQAAEKYIKAALVESGIPPLKTHDLQQLLGLFSGAAVPATVDSAAAMTSGFAWLTRYPGSPPITQQDLALAEVHLATIRQWALSTI